MEPHWERLYHAAHAALHPRKLSEWVEAGGGVLENTLFDPEERVTVKRYWISL